MTYSLHPVTSNQGTFCGEDRRAIVNKAVEQLHELEPLSLGVYGGRRMGKTSILYEIYERLTREYEPEETCVVVGYVDLGAETPNTRRILFQSIYRRLLESAKRLCRDDNYRDRLDGYSQTCNLNLNRRDPELAFSDFVEAYNALVQMMRSQYADAKVVILLDEIAHLAGKPWSTEISSKLRAFLTNNIYYPFCNKTVFVIAGTTKSLSQLLEKRGSPLENELDIFPLEIFSEEDTRELVVLYPHGGASDEVVHLIYELSGGHPMIIQYILRTVETENNPRNAENIKAAAHSFASQRSVFANWADDFNPLEKCLYRKLAECSDGLTRDHLRHLVQVHEIDDALYTLTYTGVAKKQGDTYFAAGTLFRDWFIDQGFGKEECEMTKRSVHSKGPSASQLLISALVAVAIFAATIALLVWAAGQVSGTTLIFIVIVGILFDLMSIIFVLVVNNVITRKQAMDFFNRVLDRVPFLGVFVRGNSADES